MAKNKDLSKNYVILNSQKNQYLKYYDNSTIKWNFKVLTKLFVEFDES